MKVAHLIQFLETQDPEAEVMLTDPVMKWLRMPVCKAAYQRVKLETYFPESLGRRYRLLDPDQDGGQTIIHLTP